jgi:hypothetical protein
MIECPSVSREEYKRNEERSKNANSGTPQTQCYICGSRCKNPTLWIHVTYGGAYVLMQEEATPEWMGKNPGDLGLQAVGASCVRKYPELKPYVQKIPARKK